VSNNEVSNGNGRLRGKRKLIVALLVQAMNELNLILGLIGETTWLFVTIAILTAYGATNVLTHWAHRGEGE